MDLSLTRTRLAALLGAGALALTACGGGDASPSSSSSAPASSESASASDSGPSVSRSSQSSAPAADSSASSADAASASSSDAASSSAAAQPADGEAPALADNLDQIRANMRDAETVRISAANLPDSGAESVEVSGALDGSATQGTVTGSDADFSGTMEFIHLAGVTYITMEGDGSGTDMDMMSKALAGRWLKDTQGEIPVDEMTPRSILDGVDKAFDDATEADIKATKGEVVTQGGERMYRYTDASDWSMLVDEQNNLRAFTEEGGQHQEITFSDWNGVDEPTAPAASEIVTPEQLQKEQTSSGAGSSAPASTGSSASSSVNG